MNNPIKTAFEDGRGSTISKRFDLLYQGFRLYFAILKLKLRNPYSTNPFIRSRDLTPYEIRLLIVNSYKEFKNSTGVFPDSITLSQKVYGYVMHSSFNVGLMPNFERIGVVESPFYLIILSNKSVGRYAVMDNVRPVPLYLGHLPKGANVQRTP